MLVLAGLALLLEELTARRYRRMRDQAWLLLWTAVETLGYHQLTVIWRLRGLLSYLRGSREWGVMTRTGFGAPDPPVQEPPRRR